MALKLRDAMTLSPYLASAIQLPAWEGLSVTKLYTLNAGGMISISFLCNSWPCHSHTWTIFPFFSALILVTKYTLGLLHTNSDDFPVRIRKPSFRSIPVPNPTSVTLN